MVIITDGIETKRKEGLYSQAHRLLTVREESKNVELLLAMVASVGETLALGTI